jgi:hypothetical protein
VRTYVRDLARPSLRRVAARPEERKRLGAEAVARELQHVWLEDALRLTHLYAEKEQWDKFERAAMKWLRRYLDGQHRSAETA